MPLPFLIGVGAAAATIGGYIAGKKKAEGTSSSSTNSNSNSSSSKSDK